MVKIHKSISQGRKDRIKKQLEEMVDYLGGKKDEEKCKEKEVELCVDCPEEVKGCKK